MEVAIVIIFVIGYLGITMEHTLKVDKLVPALLMMALMWAMIAFGMDGFSWWFDSDAHTMIDISKLPLHEAHEATHAASDPIASKGELLEGTLLHHLGKTAEILFFLMGAMTIVEITDHFDGFSSIKRFIKTKKKSVLLWIVSILAFFLSAVIDNLTATIVLITILRKLLTDQNDRMWFAGMIIIAANAGGAWSPIGDVTTTMLWIQNKVSAGKLVEFIFIPSLLCFAVPTIIASFMKPFKGEFHIEDNQNDESKYSFPMLILGLTAIVFVPIFKTITHLPPYVGMMLSLSIVAIAAEYLSHREFSLLRVDDRNSDGHHSPVHLSLGRIEMPSILFFLGILLAVAAMESLGLLFEFSKGMMEYIGNEKIVVMLLGVGSAIIDNVPLVAASMGMFADGLDAPVWHFIAFAAGTGGSMLIIGSAAGVVAMGMEKISFFWYLKKISWLAILGFLVGSGVFLLLE